MRLFFTVIILGLTSLAHADALGFRLSGGLWSYEVTGDVRDDPSVANNISLKDELGMKDDDVFQGFIYFEHPVPVLPNIRFGVTDLDLSGSGTFNGVKTWNGTTFPLNASVATTLDLSHTDIGLYYEIWDTGFDFDLGINIKLFDGTVTLTDNVSSTTASSTFDETIPMLYGHIGIPLVAGFSLAGDISVIEYQGDNFSDYFLSARWDSDFLLGIEVGYRSFTIDYADGNEFADVKIKGPYVNARLVF